MNRRQLISVMFFVFLSSVLLAEAGVTLISKENLVDEQTFNNYKVKIYRDKDSGEGLLLIFKDGVSVYSLDGTSFKIGLVNEDAPENTLVKMGTDITGDGVPDLVISEWSGGAHCCFTFYVFSLGKNFRFLDTIDAGDGDTSFFKDVDGDNALEFLGADWTFDYWNACFAASPRPEIILKYKDGKYQLAMDLMKKPLPSLADEEKLLQQVKDEKEDIKKDIAKDSNGSTETYAGNDAWIRKDVIIPPLVWTHMLDLIYTGHSKEAWQFLDKVWPQGKPGKEQFIKDFKEQLKKSDYWQTIKNYMEGEIR